MEGCEKMSILEFVPLLSKHIEQNTVTVIRKINCLYRLAVIGACKKNKTKKHGGMSRAQINRNQDLYFNVRFNKCYHIE